jgi:hypothetical protein
MKREGRRLLVVFERNSVGNFKEGKLKKKKTEQDELMGCLSYCFLQYIS